jgi:hypothetical protein
MIDDGMYVLECSFCKLVELTVMNSSSIDEMLFLAWVGFSV